MAHATPASRRLLLETMARRYYRVRSIADFAPLTLDGHELLVAPYEFDGGRRLLISGFVALKGVGEAALAVARHIAQTDSDRLVMVDLYAEHDGQARSQGELAAMLREQLAAVPVPAALHRMVVAVAEPGRGRGMSAIDLFTFRPGDDSFEEHEVLRGLHPLMGHRIRLWRLREFALERLPSEEDIYAFKGTAKTNPQDERLFVLAEVRDLTAVRDEDGRVIALPELEQVLVRALERIRRFQAPRPFKRRLLWNRVVLHCWPVIELAPDEIRGLIARVSQATVGLGLEMVAVQGRVRGHDGVVRERVLNFFAPSGRDVALELSDPPTEPLHPLDEGTKRIISARRRGMSHPAEIVHQLAPKQRSGDQPAGEFVEMELTEDGGLAPVHRLPATNPTGVVVGTIVNYTERYPEGMLRVILLGDPTRSLGALAEPECRRIVAAMDLAERLGVPLEWITLSAGAKIAMDSGTETMDWISDVLRRIVLFTQAGNELNVLVAGINVGAQPYFNAEATMLMHTRGALIMTPQSAMVLTGKEALDFSGAVSAEDNLGIGGYERIMGPNGQAQYWAPDLAAACTLLLDYYEHTYVAPGERFPRLARTSDPHDRDVCAAPHYAPGSGLERVGDIFSQDANAERKQPFAMRAVMHAVIDADHRPLERWGAMRSAEIGIVWDAHLGGRPVTLIGIESRPLARHGELPADGPEQWTSGTLFPRSSKKIARAINAASGRRPIVVLANLAGFDGSPESMRECQLEFGAEIGRAVVNFDGPIVFCVVSRYHGGAFVVFSQRLNPGLETVALQGARASVIGGAPAAAVVFAREVEHAASADARMQNIDRRIVAADGIERQQLRAQRSVLWEEVCAEQRRTFAERFDATHSVERAVRVGSVSRIIVPSELRSFLIEAVERGIERTLAGAPAPQPTPPGNGRTRMAHPTVG
jgi:acetyl-CoA carboxylase carboxyltransferase component